ncbi:hypothetical protein J2127_000535 [Methanococcus voltae]|nr:hypothetical protein [Methanococcus voltae]
MRFKPKVLDISPAHIILYSTLYGTLISNIIK